ncbi:MAG: hypothetical protein KJO82_00720 [Gammaproteobacteria bacterium]|nr:hypothetical protein [Gammaproteobacteria bacterium]
MNRFLTIATSSLLLAAAQNTIACDFPERPSIPDGSVATKEEMLAAKADITTYLTGVDEYLNCIEDTEQEAVAALEDPDPADLARRDELLSQKFDAANDEKALVGEEFNQQVRAYNDARQAE